MQVIRPAGTPPEALTAAAALLRSARKAVALTGAGVSVASGIPDFRSAGGLWTVFSPDEYATLEVFQRNPAKAWELYRALGRTLLGRSPNLAHRALAEMERQGLIQGIITQNVDNLHQQAGSTRVFEIHGDHQHLQCLHCATLVAATADHYQAAEIPRCPHCASPLKPNVVLFGEPVRQLEAIHACLADCDLLLVAGTSAQVYPAAALPALVRDRGGRLFEFNREQALSATEHGQVEFLFLGDVGRTLPLLLRACLAG
jgi:NAD-dependent deacetylase